MSSLCDQCFAPGQCCKRLQLSDGDGVECTFWFDDGLHGVMKEMISRDLPFVPRAVRWHGKVDDPESADHGRPYATIDFNCPWLLPNGRCGSYENRPEICSNFEPASAYLCVHYRGAEGSEGAL